MGWIIFCLKNFGTSTRTSVPESKMNAVAHEPLTWLMLTLLKKNHLNKLWKASQIYSFQKMITQ